MPADPPSPPPSAAGHKLGPLKITTWAMIGVGVGVAWWLFTRNRKAADTTATPDLSATGSPFNPNAVGLGAGGAVGGTAGHYADNESWYTAAVNALVASGYDPLAASAALSHYLSGGASLSAIESAMVSLALGRVGTPPNAPSLGTVVTPPPPTTPPPPVVTPPHVGGGGHGKPGPVARPPWLGGLRPTGATPTYSQLLANMGTLAGRQAFYAAEQGTPANTAEADANLERERLAAIALRAK